MSLKELLDDCAKEIIDDLGETFTSHDFIQRLIQVDDKKYATGLSIYVNSPDGTFKNFHSQIGRYLFKEKDHLAIIPQGKALSTNIKGRESLCEEWQRKTD